MKRSDTEIHQIELLLTLDYLLNYTDEKHPASRVDICKHAEKYGLKYDTKNEAGNDVKRQRVANCLKFLEHIAYKFPDDVPFLIETTDGGKYYLEQKNFLTEQQIIKILSAVKNDKYTQDEDVDFLLDRLLATLASKTNRDKYLKEVEKLDKNVRKYSSSGSRKFRLIYKAYTNKLMIKLRHIIYDKEKPTYWDMYYRVYFIKEFNNKLYAFLLPVSDSILKFYHNYVFEEIEKLNIPSGSERDILMIDDIPDRDMNKLFKEKCKIDAAYYKDIEDMIKANIIPQGGAGALIPSTEVQFYFYSNILNIIQPSFESFFSKKMTTGFCKQCSSFEIKEEERFSVLKHLMNKNDDKEKYMNIIPHPLKEGERPKFIVVKMSVNVDAFKAWLLSNPFDSGESTINSLVTVVAPNFINAEIERYFKMQYEAQVKKYHKNN